MSDTDPTPEPSGSPNSAPPLVIDHDPETLSQPAPIAAARRRGGTPLPLTLLLTAALGGGLYWVWTNPKPVQAGAQSDPQPAIEAARAQITASVQSQTQAIGQQLQALSGRVDALEKRPSGQAEPAPAGVSTEAMADQAKKIDDIAGRLDALAAKQDSQAAEIQKASELAAQKLPPAVATPADNAAQQVPALIAQQQAADMGGKLDRGLAEQKTATGEAVAQQKAALEAAQAQQAAATDALAQRLSRLEQGAGQDQKQQDQAAGQAKATLDALDARLAKLEQGSGQASQQEQQQDQAAQQSEQQAKTVLAALETRVGKLEQGAGQARSVAQDASRAIRIEAAQAALAAGQPLGALPDAPPALARFATVAPPTEAALREDFPRVAAAARAASQPDLSHRSFLDRALARVQQSVTVRRGDHVLVGDPASGVLSRAQEAVNAGDLKGAADRLEGLNGPAAAATRDWVAQVHALLAARASLAAMARG